MQQITRTFLPRTVAAPLEARSDALGLPAAAVLVGMLWLAYAWPWLSGHVVIPWDAKNQFYAFLRFLAASIHAGDSPAWTPHHYAGYPLVADPQSLIFTPVMRLLAMFTAEPSMRQADLFEFLGLFMGGAGCLLLFRERNWNLWGGALAAAVVIAGGPAAARLQHTGQIFSYAAIPLALWAVARTARKPSLGAGLLLGALAGLLALGRDQVAMLGCYLVAACALHAAVTAEDRKGFLRAVAAPAILAALTAFAIVVVPALLSLSLAALSNRPDIAFEVAGHGSLPPAALLTLAVANLFGSLAPSDVSYWGPGGWLWNDRQIWLERATTYLYVGMIPVALVLEGALRRRLAAPDIRFFVYALAASLIYALGWYTPAFRLLYEFVPGVSFFRRPADATFLLNLTLAILAGYSLHGLLADRSRDRVRPWHLLAPLLGVCAVGLGLAALYGTLRSSAPALGSAAALACAAVLAIEAGRRLKGAGLTGLLIVTLAALDLTLHNAGASLNSEPPRMYRALAGSGDRVANFLKGLIARDAAPDRRDRVEVLGLGGPWQNATLAQGLEGLQGNNPFQLADYSHATGIGQNSHLPERTFTPLFPSYKSPLADLLGLRYIALGKPIEQVDERIGPADMPLVARLGSVWIYENRTAFPRVFFADRYKTVDFEGLIRTGLWPKVDLHKTVLLEHAPTLPGPAVASASLAPSTRIASYRNTEIVVDVTAPRAGFLVLNDLFHPWWRAEIDGHPAPVLKANVLFRAVAVPAGRHSVRFRFEPLRGLADELWGRIAGTERSPKS